MPAGGAALTSHIIIILKTVPIYFISCCPIHYAILHRTATGTACAYTVATPIQCARLMSVVHGFMHTVVPKKYKPLTSSTLVSSKFSITDYCHHKGSFL